MPIYEFQHPETGEIFDDLRPYKDADKPFIAPDGVECPRILSSCAIIDGNKDVADYDEVLKSKPKYLRFKDGHRERFDATKHGRSAGSEHKPPKRKKKNR